MTNQANHPVIKSLVSEYIQNDDKLQHRKILAAVMACDISLDFLNMVVFVSASRKTK
jgi:hypothetical protein